MNSRETKERIAEILDVNPYGFYVLNGEDTVGVYIEYGTVTEGQIQEIMGLLGATRFEVGLQVGYEDTELVLRFQL